MAVSLACVWKIARCLPELGDRHLDVDPLPEQVAGVQVRADRLAACLAQSQQGPRVVDDESGVHLEAELHAVLGGEGRLLAASTE